jgi:hypothetical protein
LAVFTAMVLLVRVLVSSGLHFALTKYERTSSVPYGQRVAVDGGSVDVVDNAADGPTIVLLSGLGTPSPALDFAPLIRELEGHLWWSSKGSVTATRT